MPPTSGPSGPPTCQGPTYGPGDSPARTFLLRAASEGLTEQEAASFLRLLDCSKAKAPKIAAVLDTLASLGYHIEYGLLNSKYFGPPQNRERVYVVA